jgi:hypothetical protein
LHRKDIGKGEKDMAAAKTLATRLMELELEHIRKLQSGTKNVATRNVTV